MAEYRELGVEFIEEPRPSGKAGCYSFFREDDRKPSAYVDTSTGRYGDSGSTEKEITLWEFAARACPSRFATWKAAREYYADKAGVSLGRSPKGPHGKGRFNSRPAEDWKATLGFEDWTTGNLALLATWCRLHKPGVTPESVLANGGRIARYPIKESLPHGLVKVIVLPIYGPSLLAADPVGWVAWNVNGSPMEVYAGKGEPPREVKMKTIGSADGVFGKHALELLAAGTALDHCWKVEGPTDLLAGWAKTPAELRERTAWLSFAGGSKQANPWMGPLFANQIVYVLHDADEAGEVGAAKSCALISPSAREVFNPKLPYAVMPKKGPDLRDWLNSGKSYDDLHNLALRCEPFVKSAATAGTPPANSPPEVAAGSNDDPLPNEAEDDPHRLARVNLERFAAHEAGATLRYWRSLFYTWKPSQGRYELIKHDELKARIGNSIKREFDRLNVAALAEREETIRQGGEVGDEPEVRKVTKHLVSNVIEATSSTTLLSSAVEPNTWIGSGLRDRRNYIAMANGILDIDRLLAEKPTDTLALEDVLLPPSPDWFSLVRLPYAFKPESPCPRWARFLERNLEMDPERIKLLQEWAGYLLLPDTGQQRFLMLEGEGGNGKSVFLAAITAMLGRENCSHIPLEQFGDRFAKTQTIGKLANVCADTGEVDKVAEGYLKSFTSGDTMFFDRKGVDGIDCTPTARLMVSCNVRPRLSDRSWGLWRRMIIVPFNVQVGESERVANMDKDWWWEQSGELPGIFLWAVAGLHRLRQQRGFTKSEHCAAAIEDYRTESNPARAFLDDFLEVSSDGGHVKSSQVYGLYKIWAESNGYRPLGERLFGKEVIRVFAGSERRRGGPRTSRYWYYSSLQFSQNDVCGRSVADDVNDQHRRFT